MCQPGAVLLSQPLLLLPLWLQLLLLALGLLEPELLVLLAPLM